MSKKTAQIVKKYPTRVYSFACRIFNTVKLKQKRIWKKEFKIKIKIERNEIENNDKMSVQYKYPEM